MEVSASTGLVAEAEGSARFEDVPYETLRSMEDAALDALPFGVVGLNIEGIVQVYNKTEAALAGLDRDDVMGSPFFISVAQCMNNFLVAQRFEDEEELDSIISYVLTFRMRPTPVRLRLLKQPGSPCRFILIQR